MSTPKENLHPTASAMLAAWERDITMKDLASYAAQDALLVLLDNWSSAMGDGTPLANLLHDVDNVAALLAAFKAMAGAQAGVQADARQKADANLYEDLVSVGEEHGFVSDEAKDLLEQAAGVIEADPRNEAKEASNEDASSNKGRRVALEALVVLMDRHDVSLDAIFHDREGRDLDSDPETLYLVGRATAAVEVCELDLAKLIAEVQPNPPDTPKACAGCDNGEALDPCEECPDCGNVGAADEDEED